jgi:hypothetical protein
MEEQTPKNSPIDWIAVYQDSRYVFSVNGQNYDVALNGGEPPLAELEHSVTLITAWNPNSKERPQDWNEAANQRLRQSLTDSGYDFDDGWGASLPGAQEEWKESGFVVFGWTREEAARWGRTWAQRAVVFLDAQSTELIFCRDEKVVVCKLRRFPAQQ